MSKLQMFSFIYEDWTLHGGDYASKAYKKHIFDLFRI